MQLKMIGLAALSALTLMAIAASASATTTLEIGGVTQNGPLTLTMSLTPGTSSITSRTDGSLANTCTQSHMHWNTTVYTGTVVTGPLTGHTHQEKTEGRLPSDGMSSSGCTRPVTVHDPGTLEIDNIGNTNGTVFWENGEVTKSTPLGTVTCKSGETTHLGVLTGTASGHATLHIDAVLNCGFILPSAKWTATYTVTSPTGLGVSG